MKILTKKIKDALQIPQGRVDIIGTLGGMTNINYLASINGKDYVVRVPGNGTDAFINRKEEKENLELASSIGINPEHIYLNVDSGFKITRKITNAKTLTAKMAKTEGAMKKITDIFQKLHSSEVRINNRFKLFKLMDTYEKLAFEAGALFFEGYEGVKRDIMILKSHYETLEVREYPCHIDPTYTNFIYSVKNKIYLIDWEYSGMFDPLWDVAAHMLESKFTKSEQALFLALYFQRDITQLEYKRIAIHNIFQDYLWSLWTLFKEAKGDDFGSYGSDRFDRTKGNIMAFKEKYCTN